MPSRIFSFGVAFLMRGALMTAFSGDTVSTADCTPIIIYDPEHHAAAVVHAGWRGTVARIAEKTVAKMQNVYHSRPHMMRAVIGPCITVKNFEVGDEVYEAFADASFPMSQIALRQDKWHMHSPLQSVAALVDGHTC